MATSARKLRGKRPPSSTVLGSPCPAFHDHRGAAGIRCWPELVTVELMNWRDGAMLRRYAAARNPLKRQAVASF